LVADSSRPTGSHTAAAATSVATLARIRKAER
jgi:hypothetical protein